MRVRGRRLLDLLLICVLLVQLPATTAPVLALDDFARVAGNVVGTTGLNIRSCPKVSCPSEGLAQLNDPIIVTGEAEDGFVPVQWAGKAGWAWQLYVSTDAIGAPYLYTGTPGCNRVAIIFNIGIGEPLQLEPLRWLKEQNVPATVFPMGWWAQLFPDDLRAIDQLGFPIGSHGDVRLNLTGFSDDEVVADLKDSYAHIGQVIGKEPIPYFTPYAADMDDRVRGQVAREGYLPVGWDVAADDYGEGVSPEDVYNRVVPDVDDGSIIEFHLDGPSSAQSTAVVLPSIVTDLKKRGFQFVSIPDMAQPCGAPKSDAATPGAASPTPGSSPTPLPAATAAVTPTP